MRWALLYRASPLVADEATDDRVAALTRMLSRRGWRPVTVQARGNRDHLSVLCEGGDQAPALQVPGLELVAATEVEEPGELPDPPLAEPDPRVVEPQPTRWQQVRGRGERELDVVYGRGVSGRLHSVTVEESPDEVVVTVRIGTFPNLPEGIMVTLQLIIEAVRLTLETPLGDRPVRDGAPGGRR